MRKSLIGAAATGLLALGQTAAAQTPAWSDSKNLTVQTTVPVYCQTSIFGSDPSINVGSLVDNQGELVGAFQGTSTITTSVNYYCNAPSKITLLAEPLANTTQPTSIAGFDRQVDYLTTLDWGGVGLTALSTATTASEKVFSQAHIGLISLAVSEPVSPSGLRPLAGDYEGRVTLTITAQP